eukprot:TRINITY_DN4112_c0_g1_i3.p1 TRINITY_DN4112_c0_g1~~TRINITY_DN4112_c0_g1_i3.p1  ORF type:complete len:456 (-),score=108.16 TRINITY_DN4112_c0_g1_i3:41-1408(-)
MDLLPRELIEVILLKLPVHSFLRATATCSSYRVWYEDEDVWSAFVQRDYGSETPTSTWFDLYKELHTFETIKVERSTRTDGFPVIKTMLLGPDKAGKSSIMLRFADGLFSDNYLMTIGVDFRIVPLRFPTKPSFGDFRLQIWDTAGQDRFQTITQAFYRGAECAIIVFDVTDRQSYERALDYQPTLERYGSETMPRCTVFVGNKIDLVDQRIVTFEEARTRARELGWHYVETSARADKRCTNPFAIAAMLAATIRKPEIFRTDIPQPVFTDSEPSHGFGQDNFDRFKDFVGEVKDALTPGDRAEAVGQKVKSFFVSVKEKLTPSDDHTAASAAAADPDVGTEHMSTGQKIENKFKSIVDTIKEKLQRPDAAATPNAVSDSAASASVDDNSAATTATHEDIRLSSIDRPGPAAQGTVGQKVDKFFSDVKQKLTPEDDGKVAGLFKSFKSFVTKKTG